MAQLDSDQYLRLTPETTYGQSDGLYYDKDNALLVMVIDDAIVMSVDAAGAILAGAIEAPDLAIASQAQGDLLRYSGSEWERLAAATSGQILVGDGTDIISAPLTGDASLSAAGALTVTDVTVGSDATGDILYKSSATALARLSIGSEGTYLMINTGASAPSWEVLNQKMSFRIPTTSGIDTDAYNGGLAGCDQALDVKLTDPGATYCKVYDASAAAYANLETGSAGDFIQWQLLPNNTQNTDITYLGNVNPFCQIYMDMSATNQTYTNDALVWEYYNGSTCSALTIRDYTDATAQDGLRSFGRDGSISFVPPADWVAVAIDSVTAFWIRASAGTAANISQIGITNGVRHKIASPTDGFYIPFSCNITDLSIRDESATVHTAADVKFVLFNFSSAATTDAVGSDSGELTFAQDKRNDGYTGLPLIVIAGDYLGVLITQEDGTNEIGPFTIEITAQITGA